MNTLRLWLLLLLALLLPIRGAMAAAMACPAMGAGSHAQARGDAPRSAHCLAREAVAAPEILHDVQPTVAHDQAAHLHTAGSPGEAAIDAAGDTAADTQGTLPNDTESAANACNLCSAFCSATPLLSSLPAWAQPRNFFAVSFPELQAPVPTFLSGGQERPPRTS